MPMGKRRVAYVTLPGHRVKPPLLAIARYQERFALGQDLEPATVDPVDVIPLCIPHLGYHHNLAIGEPEQKWTHRRHYDGCGQDWLLRQSQP